MLGMLVSRVKPEAELTAHSSASDGQYWRALARGSGHVKAGFPLQGVAETYSRGKRDRTILEHLASFGSAALQPLCL